MKNLFLSPLSAIFFILCLIAFSIMAFKVFSLNFPLTTSQEKTLWQYETKIRYNATGGPQKVRAWIPKNTERFIINEQDFFSGDYGLTVAKLNSGNRAEWSVREATGWQTFFYRGLIEPVDDDLGESNQSEIVVEKPIFTKIESEVAQMVISRAEKVSADHESLILQMIATLNDRNSMDNLSVLLPAGRDSVLTVLVRLLGDQGIPAKIANGVYLREGSTEGRINNWLQVYNGKTWQLFDPVTEQVIPNDEALVIWTGFDKFITVNDRASDIDFQVILKPRSENLLTFFQLRKNESKHWLIDYSFFSLPLSIPTDFKTLVTIPIGVLLLVILRNIIGIKTFGTFLPILVSLSFRDTGLVAGIILFTLVVVLGLLTRQLLDRLNLLMIPRVGSILVVVLLFMVTIAMLSFKLGIDIGLSVTLFPMVILAIMIERMSILWDERGPFEVFKQAMGTVMVAALGFWIMNLPTLQHILFVFPELLLVVLGFTMVMGRYTGYKLTELFRFRAIIDSAMTRRN